MYIAKKKLTLFSTRALIEAYHVFNTLNSLYNDIKKKAKKYWLVFLVLYPKFRSANACGGTNKVQVWNWINWYKKKPISTILLLIRNFFLSFFLCHSSFSFTARTFPTHPYFSQPLGQGQLELFNLLKAYSILDGDVGYCQGLSFIAALILMHVSMLA